MALNVNRNVVDPFYRYKMPRLVAKVEGKGNGVKTVIPNMVDIAKSLDRPPTYVTKFFGCELGAQTQFDFKNDRYIVNGVHEAGKLQDMLDTFIKKFVLCEQCENPETHFKILEKKGIIKSSCAACGHSFQIDMRHKLTTYIIKNPPGQELNAHGTSLTKRQAKKSERKKAGAENGNDADGDDDGLNGSMNNTARDDDWGDDDENVDWGEDVSEEAVKKRMKDLTSGVANLAMNDDLEKTETERINLFHDFVKRLVDEGKDEVGKKDKEIFADAERLDIVNKAPIVLCELLFDDSMVAQIKKYKRVFMRFCHENTKAQKYFMGGFEKTVEIRKDKLLPKVPVILKTLYDEDVIDEESILEWAKKVSKKYVSKELSEQIHKKAEPFIKWLKEAEEETSDEDEDEVELEFDDRAKISTLQEKKDNTEKEKTPENNKASNGNGAANAKEDSEDEVDIDDI